jgi:hypothetical protein
MKGTFFDNTGKVTAVYIIEGRKRRFIKSDEPDKDNDRIVRAAPVFPGSK